MQHKGTPHEDRSYNLCIVTRGYLDVVQCIFYNGARASAKLPNKPIKIVVPFVPGGGSDSVARVIAKGMTEQLGQPVVVENRGGANTIIGSEYVAKSAPDGYTLLVCTTAFATNPSMYKLPFDTISLSMPEILCSSVHYRPKSLKRSSKLILRDGEKS